MVVQRRLPQYLARLIRHQAWDGGARHCFSTMLSMLVAVTADPAHGRAIQIVANMTQDEKLSWLHGHSVASQAGLKGYTGECPAIARLGIPALRLNDGPQGFRDSHAHGTTTCWPSGLTVAATFDPAAANAWGAAIGREFKGKGANVALGPGMNVARVPQDGRNFEYISVPAARARARNPLVPRTQRLTLCISLQGEDPALGAAMAAAAIRGIQGEGVIANAKHYILNNQETDRGSAPLPWKGVSAARHLARTVLCRTGSALTRVTTAGARPSTSAPSARSTFRAPSDDPACNLLAPRAPPADR